MINKTGEDHKAAWISSWIVDKGTQFLRKYKWAKMNGKMLTHYCKDLRTNYNQKVETREINIGLSLVISGKLPKLSQNSGLSLTGNLNLQKAPLTSSVSNIGTAKTVTRDMWMMS